jgi:hypothetical protein
MLAVFKPFATELAEWKKDYESLVVDCTTPQGMKSAKDSRKEIRDSYKNLEDIKKEAKAPILEKGRLIDAQYKELDAQLKELFQKFDKPIKEVENAKQIAAEKAAKDALAKQDELLERERKVYLKEVELGLRDKDIKLEQELGLADETTTEETEEAEEAVADDSSASASSGSANDVADAAIICEPHIKAASERLGVIKKVRALIEPTDAQPTGEIDEKIARQHDEVLEAVWEIVDEYK